MKVIKLKDLSQIEYQRIVKRSSGVNPQILPAVRKTMDDVKKFGDKILVADYKRRFGNDRYTSLLVSKGDIQQAYKGVNKEFISGIRQMVKNITAVHKAQLPKNKDTVVFPEKGISVWREWRPIEKVGLYIPGGKAIYPSSVLMTGIPAKIAGCKEIIMCSPARDNGQIPAPTLVAADMIGITRIYKIGGAAAIAVFAYGIETIPNVYKIFGAGNSFVTAAKMVALETVSIDMPAGPSEIFIIADKTANPAFIAADLLADGEHGNDSACVLITTSKQVAEKTVTEIERQLSQLSTASRVKDSLKKYGLFAVVDSMDAAIAFANEYAPEHLGIMTKNPQNLVEKIQNAGSVFLGNWTTKSSGDYATGANHVLPTGGMAKMYPPLSVESFGKWMQVQRCTKEGLQNIRRTVETIADVEQLPAHKYSASIRFE